MCRPLRILISLGVVLLLWAASKSVAADDGAEQAALDRMSRPPLGLPAIEFPADNVPTTDKIRLGRKLFFDTRLSAEGTMSCGTCHLPDQGFTVNGYPTAIGKGGLPLRRNAPTLLNVAFQRTLFRDGRRTSLERQALDPFVAPDEMANPSLLAVMEKIRSLKDYEGAFERVFGRGPTPQALAQAIASYERTLLAGDSPFDRWHFGRQEQAVDESAKRGFELFRGKAGCIVCHQFSDSNPLFTDHQFRDAGVGWKRSRTGPSGQGRYDAQNAALGPQHSDFGRFEVTQDPTDMFKYQTPTLRNIALTAPYMHDGSLATLRDVVEYYDRGGFHSYGIDPLIRPLSLNWEEQQDLIAFLESLTSAGIGELQEEAGGRPSLSE
jgi:cytochrome c peroxidase